MTEKYTHNVRPTSLARNGVFDNAVQSYLCGVPIQLPRETDPPIAVIICRCQLNSQSMIPDIVNDPLLSPTSKRFFGFKSPCMSTMR